MAREDYPRESARQLSRPARRRGESHGRSPASDRRHRAGRRPGHADEVRAGEGAAPDRGSADALLSARGGRGAAAAAPDRGGRARCRAGHAEPRGPRRERAPGAAARHRSRGAADRARARRLPRRRADPVWRYAAAARRDARAHGPVQGRDRRRSRDALGAGERARHRRARRGGQARAHRRGDRRDAGRARDRGAQHGRVSGRRGAALEAARAGRRPEPPGRDLPDDHRRDRRARRPRASRC